MTYLSIPWDAAAGSPAYSAADFRGLFKTLHGPAGRLADAGVIPSSVGLLRVYASNPASLAVHVEPGYALINGLYAGSDAAVDLTLDAADPTYGRFDLVVFRSDATGKTVSIALVKGTAGPAPAVPALTQAGTTYEIPLASVYLAAGATTISQPAIRQLAVPGAAAACEIQMCRIVTTVTALDAVAFGDVVCWAQQEYPTASPASLDGYYYNYVSIYNNTRTQLAGIALAAGDAEDVIPVLTRGVWLGALADESQTINVGDLIGVEHQFLPVRTEPTLQIATVGAHGTGGETLPLGYAMQWIRSTAGQNPPLAIFVDPLRFAALPRWKSTGGSGSNVTNNTAGSWTDLFAISALYTRTRYLQVSVNLACSNSAAGNRTKFTVNVDGTDMDVQWDQAAPVANYRQMCSLNIIVDLVALSITPVNNTHTIKLCWQPSAGTSTVYGAAGEVQPTFVVRELMEKPY